MDSYSITLFNTPIILTELQIAFAFYTAFAVVSIVMHKELNKKIRKIVLALIDKKISSTVAQESASYLNQKRTQNKFILFLHCSIVFILVSHYVINNYSKYTNLLIQAF